MKESLRPALLLQGLCSTLQKHRKCGVRHKSTSVGMKSYSLSAMEQGSLKALHCLLRGADFSALPDGYMFEGFIPGRLESTKQGLELHGEIWFMGGVPSYTAHINLCRPTFNSVASATTKRLLRAEVLELILSDDVVKIRIGKKPEQVAAEQPAISPSIS